ncbi:MAG: type II toxin-antitoxin system YhaV family toxin [Leptospirales bacterium]
MSRSKNVPLVVNVWTIFGQPLFLDQFETLTQQIEGPKQKNPGGFIKKNPTKRMAAIAKLAFSVIPQDPSRPEYRQGDTPRKRTQALVPCQVLSAVPAVLPLSLSKQSDRLRMGE